LILYLRNRNSVFPGASETAIATQVIGRCLVSFGPRVCRGLKIRALLSLAATSCDSVMLDAILSLDVFVTFNNSFIKSSTPPGISAKTTLDLRGLLQMPISGGFVIPRPRIG
jgi:hypothetical protein